jgi:predicted acetyltransferase
MVIRQLAADEMELHVRLSEYAFQYELSQEQREEATKKVKPEHVWGAFIEGQLASKMVILPLETYVYGKVLRLGGIASVATWPEFRRQGLVAKLLTHGLEVMRNQGQLLSYLAPFSFPFYRKYGWEIHGEFKSWKLDVKQLPKVEGKGKVERVARSDKRIYDVYEQYASRFNGTLRRSADWWEWRVFPTQKKGVVALYLNEQGEARGYLFYQVTEQKMNIHEFVSLDHDSYLGLWQLIRQHDSMIKEVNLKTPVHDPLPYIVDDPELEQRVIPYFMVRIIDVQRFLERVPLRWNETDEKHFLHVTDPHATWNDGTFLLEKGEVDRKDDIVNRVTFYPRKTETVSCMNKPRKGISCDIQTLSTMLLGYQKPALLHRLGKLHAEQSELDNWEKLLPEAETYLLDFF